MKTVKFATVLLLLTVTSGFAMERGVNLSVPGMYCASCPYVVKAAIGKVDGVFSVTTDATRKTAFVIYDDAVTTIDAITEASANAGYEASVITENAEQS